MDELIRVEDDGREFEFAVSARLRHGPLWRICQKYGSQAAAARELGISTTQMNQLVNLRFKKPPAGAYWWPGFVKKLASLTGMLPEDLFPDWIGEDVLDLPRTSTQYRLLSIQDIKALPAPHPEPREMIGEALDVTMRKVLSSREREVLRHRFGIDGCEPKTLEQVSEILGVTKERVRTIEVKALAHMKKNKQAIAAVIGMPARETAELDATHENDNRHCARKGCFNVFRKSDQGRNDVHERYCSKRCHRLDEMRYGDGRRPDRGPDEVSPP